MAVVERKTETVNLRLSPSMKKLLRAAADREHRTLSNMIESLVLAYCEQNGIRPAAESMDAARSPGRSQG